MCSCVTAAKKQQKKPTTARKQKKKSTVSLSDTASSDSEFEQKNPSLVKTQKKNSSTLPSNSGTDPTINISSSDEEPQIQGGITIQKVRFSAAEVRAIEKGECLRDVHIALAHSLLKQQFPDRAGFQSTLYVANGRCIPQKEGRIQLHFDEERKHWLTSSFSG